MLIPSFELVYAALVLATIQENNSDQLVKIQPQDWSGRGHQGSSRNTVIPQPGLYWILQRSPHIHGLFHIFATITAMAS